MSPRPLSRSSFRDAGSAGPDGAIRNRGALDLIECSFDGNFARTHGGLGDGFETPAIPPSP